MGCLLKSEEVEEETSDRSKFLERSLKKKEPSELQGSLPAFLATKQ